MPWIVKKSGDKFCVYKEGTDDPIAGGCHTKRADATRQMRALYANVKEAKAYSELTLNEDRLSMLVSLKFSESDVVDGQLRKWVHAIPFGKWDHPMYGMSFFDKWQAENMVRHFHDKVHGTETLHTDYEHGLDPAKGTKASGTIIDMEVRTDGLYKHIEFTKEATQEILDGEWNYYSPEYNDIWENPMDNIIRSDVVRGGALTNKPWIKGMVPLNFSELVTIKNDIEEQEHHDPGHDPEDGPPQDDRTGDNKDSRSRIDTPPNIQVEPEDSMNEKVLAALGLDADATQEQIDEAVLQMATEIAPLREAAAEVTEQKKFSEMYPEQAAELNRLRSESVNNNAKLFSEKYERFNVTVKRGDDDEEVTVIRGFSALALEKLSDLHKRFSEGTATEEHLGEALDVIVADGVVEYSESGTSVDHTDEDEAVGPTDAGKKLAEYAQKLIDEAGDDKLSWGDAIAKAAKEHPDLAKKYSERVTRRREEA